MIEKFDRDAFRVRFYKTGQTQREFGLNIGVSASAISQYINGYSTPSKEKLEKIAEALHCGVDDLLVGGAEEKPSEAEKSTKYTTEEKESVAFESLLTAIELIKIARDMLGEIRKGEKKND